MLSSDNQREMLKKQLKQQEHYTLKKLTVGVASVLVGVSFLGAQSVSADDTATPVTPQKQRVVQPATDQTTSAASEASSIPDDLVAVAYSTAEKTKLDQSLPVITSNQQSTADAAMKSAGYYQILGLPSDAQYNLSVSAKNSSTTGDQAGKTSTIYAPAYTLAADHVLSEAEHTNTALVNYRTAEDLTINLDLVNPTSRDMAGIKPVISLNEWVPHGDSNVLTFGSWGEILDQNGHQVSGLTFEYYFSSRNAYLTKEQAEAAGLTYDQTCQLKVVGTLAANSSVKVEMPLSIDKDDVASYYETNINPYRTEVTLDNTGENSLIYLSPSAPRWALSDVANDEILPMTKVKMDVYRALPSSVYEALRQALPRAEGQITEIENIDDLSGSQNDTDLVNWYGGSYNIKLDKLKSILRNYGYSVEPVVDQVGSITGFKDSYHYVSMPLLQVENGDGSSSNKDTNIGFYVEVYPILLTKNTEYTQGDSALDNWTSTNNLTAVNNLAALAPDETGGNFKQVAVDPSEATLLSIKDQNGNTLKTIDSKTPAGTYTLTYQYYLNGVEDPDYLFTNTATVTIKPVGTPVTPDQPEQPDQPVTPETPGDSGEISGGNDTGKDQSTTTTTTTEQTTGDSTDNSETPSDSGVITGGNNSAKDQSTMTTNTTGQANVVTTGNQQSQKTAQRLPQTGSYDSLAMAGLGLTAMAAMLGFAVISKRKHD